MKSIYIVGAQCTGKTTLTEAIALELRRRNPDMKLEIISEMARSVLEKHNFNRDDVRGGSERCLLLQKLILESQQVRESSMTEDTILLSDRSGIDPLVYAMVFAKDQSLVDALTHSPAWDKLRERMARSTVVVCEPVTDWLVDDGVRLIPQDHEEWTRLHETFCRMLSSSGIEYRAIPASMRSLSDRVDYVLDL